MSCHPEWWQLFFARLRRSEAFLGFLFLKDITIVTNIPCADAAVAALPVVCARTRYQN